MKKPIHHLLVFAALLSVTLTGCLKDKCTEKRTFIIYEPVYGQADALREGIVLEAPRPLINPGKIYSYGTWLLINDISEGLHIIDNSQPEQPIHLAFLAIPGNRDMAIYNEVLYADNYMDLVAFDIQQITQPELVHRTENLFQNWTQTPKGVIIDYIETEETIESDCNSPSFFMMEDFFMAADPSILSNSGAFPSALAQVSGVGGSMARFTIAASHLYVVDRFNLHVFGLQQPQQPQPLATQHIGWDIETIFPYQNYLFIGSESGMFIFDNSQPTNPVQLSRFEHARACDPVVTDGQYAYVTLRDGSECLGYINQLDVVDISDLRNPKLVKTYPMTHPMGLSVRENTLFLCDDFAGLRIFDKSDVLKIGERQIAHIKGKATFDVIALPGSSRILVVGPDGFSQYDAADPSNPILLSHLPVQK